jgi:thioredoxin reductase (NADPH)
MDQQDLRDVVIIGSGPAGLTAAVYSARANLHPLVLEGEPSSTSDQPGGQLMLTTEVENFPGFADGIMGPALMAEMRAQAARFEAELIATRVTSVDFSHHPHTVRYLDQSSGEEIEVRARTVIISTGAQAKMLGLPSEERLLGHGVSACATCDGFFFRGQDIAVVGGGDSALEEANFLTKFASSVTLIVRRRELRASKIMQDRTTANPKIRILWEHVVTDVLGDKQMTGLRVAHTLTGQEQDLPVTGLFVAIGHEPNTSLFRGQITLDEAGYIVTHGGTTATNIDGVFAAGDVQDHRYRQAVTAAGSGCMAALDAERWLEAHVGLPQMTEDWAS